MSSRLGSHRLAAAVVLAVAAALVAILPASATIFLPTVGFEDDVDLVVAPDGEFLVLCEERQDGALPKVSIINIDPATGEPLGVAYSEAALGFENGVDPIVVPQFAAVADGYAVLVPQESEDGLLAAVLVLRVNAAGVLLERKLFTLGDLGFAPDVDGVATIYPDRLIAFFPLTNEPGTVNGVLAIDIDTRDDSFGTGTLLSTDGRVGAEVNLLVAFLPGLAEAMDPVAFNSEVSARLALPVRSPAGVCDLLLIDFDPGCGPACEPPIFMGYVSVKDANATGANPLDFPGYERDVDIALFGPSECGLAALLYHILIPVEGPGDVGDLYMVNQDGGYEWAFSDVSTGTTIPGYEIGVDMLRLCDLGLASNPNRLAVPVENAAGTSADLLILDTPTGALLNRVNNPALNPGDPLIGYEIGVDPLPWLTGGLMLVPVENAVSAALLAVGPGAAVVSSLVDGPVLGFIRSVDPIVSPLPDADRTLLVPVGKDDGTDLDVLRFFAPPNLAAVNSLELVNPGTTFGPFVWDMDVGLIDKTVPGGAWLYLPEEPPGGGPSRLRFENVPTVLAGRVLAVAQGAVGAIPGSLGFFRSSDGTLVLEHDDVLGLETGLDMANGRGPTIRANPPALGVPVGYDGDTDPTLAWLTSPVGVPPGGGASGLWLSHANPLGLPAPIRFGIPRAGAVRVEVLDLAGRAVRELFAGEREAGGHTLVWDGRDAGGRAVRTGVYLIVVRADGAASMSKAVVIR